MLDTGVWAQSLIGHAGLSPPAIRAISTARAVYISPISVYEIAQKCRIGKWDDMLPFVADLPKLADEQGGQWAQLGPEILTDAALMKWEHRDPFDRMIVATAKRFGMHVITSDQTILAHLGEEYATNSRQPS